MLIRTCSPLRLDFASTEYPQRLAPHCSMRTLPSFSSVIQMPTGELASLTAAVAGAGPCGRCTGVGACAGAGGELPRPQEMARILARGPDPSEPAARMP